MYVYRKLKHYFNIHCKSPCHIVWGSLKKAQVSYVEEHSQMTSFYYYYF